MFMTGVLCTVCGAQVYLYLQRSKGIEHHSQISLSWALLHAMHIFPLSSLDFGVLSWKCNNCFTSKSVLSEKWHSLSSYYSKSKCTLMWQFVCDLIRHYHNIWRIQLNIENIVHLAINLESVIISQWTLKMSVYVIISNPFCLQTNSWLYRVLRITSVN